MKASEAVAEEDKHVPSHSDSVELNHSSSFQISHSGISTSHELQPRLTKSSDNLTVVEIEDADAKADDGTTEKVCRHKV